MTTMDSSQGCAELQTRPLLPLVLNTGLLSPSLLDLSPRMESHFKSPLGKLKRGTDAENLLLLE